MEAKITAGRLRSVLLLDKMKAPSGIEDLLKSEIYGIFENYFVTLPKTVQVRLAIDENDLFDISISLKAERVKDVGRILTDR